MSAVTNTDRQTGTILAERLGLTITKTEGHDLAGPCIACKSSDAFRLHQDEGVAQCYSCGGKWSPFQVAETVLGNCEQAKQLFIDMGIFKPIPETGGLVEMVDDPVDVIARQKHVPVESFRAYGATKASPLTISIPAYGPDGSACTTMTLSTRGGKGTLAKGKPAGLYFPHEDAKVRLPKSGETWHVVEGPKDAAALHSMGLLVCGLNTCRMAVKFARLFEDVDIILVPDRDRAGEEGAQHSARVLRGVASSVRTAVLPAEFKESGGEDVRDVLRRRGGRELVLQSIADAKLDGDGEVGGDMPSQATLAASVAANWELWHTPAKDAYATFPVGEHSETWSVRSKMFKRFLAKQFFEKYGKAMNAEALGTAINLIEAQSLFDGEEHSAHVRVAEHEGNIYVDLCNDAWEAIEVTSSGWQVIDEAPIKFRRSRAMLPLPNPEVGGSVDELRGFLNVDDSNWPLVIAWLIAAFRPRGPYPVLALFAEQGSGKSTTGRLLRNLIDPNTAPLRAEPRTARDLMIAANNSRCVAFDNLSYVPSWLSDALCRLSTGGGFATRELYTDQDEVIFDAMRPILLTSIEEVATRSDLLDRCLIIWLPAIPKNRRRPEAELERDFDEARPRLLGTLLSTVAGALGDLPSTEVNDLPRMADFALWATAAESALGWSKGTFMAAYNGNRQSANDLALESSTIGRPLLDLLGNRGEWSGTASELLETLETRVSDPAKRQKSWPKNGRSVAGHLKRLAPNLRAAGWEVEYQRQASQRLWSIRRLTDFASSDTSASHLRHPDVGAEQCKAMQKDAIQPVHDGDDANDANPGTPTAASADGGLAWEEGEL